MNHPREPLVSGISVIEIGNDYTAIIVIDADDGADTTTFVRPASQHPNREFNWWAHCNFDHDAPEPVRDVDETKMLDELVAQYRAGIKVRG